MGATVFLTFFSGLRGLTGTDTITYLFFYQADLYPDSMEKIYLGMSRFFARNGAPFYVFQLVVSFLTIFPIFVQYWKKSKNLYFIFFLFFLFSFYLYSFNVSRQTLAAAILAYAYLSLNKKSIRSIALFIFLGVISIGIHQSSLYIFIALIILNFVGEVLFNSKIKLMLIGIMGIIFSLFFYKTNYVFDKLTSLQTSFPDYSAYITTATAVGVLTNKSVTTLVIALIGSIIILLYSRYPHEDRNIQLFSPFFLFIIFEILQVNWISDRMAVFLLPIIPLFLTHMVYDKSGVNISNKLRYVVLILVILMGSVEFGRMVIQNFGQISPYMGG
jgi:hypothetical protein